jgi:predicted transposase YbfD/YdcC
MVLSIACGQRKLRDAETLSHKLNKSIRRHLDLPKAGVSDTTLHEMLTNLIPYGFREAIYKQLREDVDSKAITNDLLKRGVLSIDGKGAGCRKGERPNRFCQHTFLGPEAAEAWRFFVLRAALVSSSARPILDQEPMPELVGEATAFPTVFKRVVQKFPRLFRYVTSDAGITSADNARKVRFASKHYVFAVKPNHRRLYDAARALLAEAPVEAKTEEQARGYTEVRQLQLCTVTPEGIDYPDAHQILKVTRIRTPKHGEVEVGERIYITSVPGYELTPSEILQLVRLHWGIENGGNWTADAVLKEDTHSPCYQGYGVVVMSWLNILAYNLIAVFRAHTPKRYDYRAPWREVVLAVYEVLSFWEVELIVG